MSARAIEGTWLACARTDTPACIRMLFLVIEAVSAATSTSRIREFAEASSPYETFSKTANGANCS